MSCVDCGCAYPSCWWKQPAQANRCAKVKCQACGELRCHSEGLARGTCRLCLYGRLDGWSHDSRPKVCTYKGCEKPAVYSYLPGSKPDCCKAHGQAIIARKTR